MNPKVAISITEGRVVRDLFENGFLDMVIAQNMEIMFFTPATRVPDFAERWLRPGITFHTLPPYEMEVNLSRFLRMRNLLLKHASSLIPPWDKLMRKHSHPNPELVEKIRGARLAIITHPMFHTEYPLFRAAAELNISTLGVLRSWDNLYKGLRIIPDVLAVWNQVNRQEAIDLMGYSSDCVEVIGGAQFDPYFAPDSNWSRQEFSQRLGLDPARPIITLATLGAFLHLFDETYLVDFLLKAIKDGSIPGSPQLVIRLHPASKLEYFRKYSNHPDVRLSYIQGYIPSLGWTMTRDDVIFVANLLRHSSVVVSPGSTITIETAIFDTPTVVPLFHTYQPELGKEQFDFHMTRHFKRLAELDLVPIVRKPEELIAVVSRFLSEPTWYQAQRSQLVENYITYTDGKSTKRLVDLMARLAQKTR